MVAVTTQRLTNLRISVAFSELLQKIEMGAGRANVANTVMKVLESVNGIWRPAIIYSWLYHEPDPTAVNCHFLYNHQNRVRLDLGHSSSFLTGASYVLVAAFTCGPEIDEAAKKAGQENKHLQEYIIDLVGLIVLEKTCEIVKQIAEHKAKAIGWGVSPFLSPGSVHGWDLAEQLEICALLPLSEIGLTVSKDAVLAPFKSLTCIIGIGPTYDSAKVGATCAACAKKDVCQMKLL